MELDLFDLFRFLHVLTMFAAVAAAVAPETIVHSLARKGDIAALRAIGPTMRPVAVLAPALFLAGLVLGLLAAAAGSLDFFRPWLIASYVVFAIVFVVAGAVGGRWQGAVMEAAADPEASAGSAAFQAARNDVRGTISVWTSYIGLIVIVFLMVVKPGA